jgi:hypothetical protein
LTAETQFRWEELASERFCHEICLLVEMKLEEIIRHFLTTVNFQELLIALKRILSRHIQEWLSLARWRLNYPPGVINIHAISSNIFFFLIYLGIHTGESDMAGDSTFSGITGVLS